MLVGISDPSVRKGCRLVCGCRSTNCSPTADRLATTALVSLGMSLWSFSMLRITSTPLLVSFMLLTLPTVTPR